MMDNQLKSILGTVFDLSAEEIHDGTSPENVGLWNSLNHLRLITEIEKALQIRVTQKEIREMITYGKIREVVGRHLSFKTVE
jgi:acyl carrier protein